MKTDLKKLLAKHPGASAAELGKLAAFMRKHTLRGAMKPGSTFGARHPMLSYEMGLRVETWHLVLELFDLLAEAAPAPAKAPASTEATASSEAVKP